MLPKCSMLPIVRLTFPRFEFMSLELEISPWFAVFHQTWHRHLSFKPSNQNNYDWPSLVDGFPQNNLGSFPPGVSLLHAHGGRLWWRVSRAHQIPGRCGASPARPMGRGRGNVPLGFFEWRVSAWKMESSMDFTWFKHEGYRFNMIQHYDHDVWLFDHDHEKRTKIEASSMKNEDWHINNKLLMSRTW